MSDKAETPAHPSFQVIHAPKRTESTGEKSVFLAGTTDPKDVDWRMSLAASLSQLPITVYNPYRPDWTSEWKEDIDYPPFREQVEWELDMQEKADLVFVYYQAHTLAPISLLELGLCAGALTKEKKVIVVCDPGYEKRGNVQLVCERRGILCLDKMDRGLVAAVKEILGFGTPEPRPRTGTLCLLDEF